MKIEKLTKFLKSISELEDKLGVEVSQITPEHIKDYYNENYGEIALRTVYKYLNESEEWLSLESKTVKSFVLTEHRPTSNSLPDEYLVDEDGDEVPPKDYPSVWAYPKGEKTLKAYHLNEKGQQFLELNAEK